MDHRWSVIPITKGQKCRNCFRVMTSSWRQNYARRFKAHGIILRAASVPTVQILTSQWRHDEHDSVSNHQPHDCLLNGLFGRRSKVTSKLRVTGLCVGNSPVTGEFPAQKASNAKNVSIWWRHHETMHFTLIIFLMIQSDDWFGHVTIALLLRYMQNIGHIK